jgi:deoxyribonuclease V
LVYFPSKCRFIPGIFRQRRPSRFKTDYALRFAFSPLTDEPKLVAGADISFDIGSDTVYAGIVVLSFPDLQIVEERGVRTEAHFPYVQAYFPFENLPRL